MPPARARIERGNELDGVQASVNPPSSRPITAPPSRPRICCESGRVSGYQASVIDHHHHGGQGTMSHDVPEEQVRPRLIGSAVRPTGAGAVDGDAAAVPRLGWALALTTPIVFSGAAIRSDKAALNSARRKFDDGHPGVARHSRPYVIRWSCWCTALVGRHGSRRGPIYFRWRGGLRCFYWPGATRRPRPTLGGFRLRALLSRAPRTPCCARDGAEVRIPAGELAVGA